MLGHARYGGNASKLYLESIRKYEQDICTLIDCQLWENPPVAPTKQQVPKGHTA